MDLVLYFSVFIVVVALAIFGVANLYQWSLYLLEKSPKKSNKYLLYGLLLIFPAPIYIDYVIRELSLVLPSHLEYINRPAVFIFILSSLIGLSIFLLFLNFFFEKKIKNVFITLIMGSVVFVFFAPSMYFTVTPFVKKYYADKTSVAKGVLERCSERGSDYACMKMAKLYIEGEGVEQDYAKAIALYEKSSEANSSYGSYQLGLIYEEGEIAKRDLTLSTSYYKKSCQLGSINGCMKLASSYATGRGVRQDMESAEALYFKYCISGTKDACLGYLDIHGRKSMKSYSTDKGFNGKLEDDPSNWSRAFSTPLPENITILKSLFKSSYGLCCTRYSYYFKIKMSDRDRKIALSKLEKIKEEDVEELEDIFPENFKLETFDNYEIYKENGVSILVHKKTNVIYLHEDVYIDGR